LPLKSNIISKISLAKLLWFRLEIFIKTQKLEFLPNWKAKTQEEALKTDLLLI
jgi:hypothetical protein